MAPRHKGHNKMRKILAILSLAFTITWALYKLSVTGNVYFSKLQELHYCNMIYDYKCII